LEKSILKLLKIYHEDTRKRRKRYEIECFSVVDMELLRERQNKRGD